MIVNDDDDDDDDDDDEIIKTERDEVLSPVTTECDRL
jgi:hypothetical protein